VLVFQDLLVVPMVLLVPLLGAPMSEIALPIGVALGKAAAMIVGVVAVSRFLVPRLMDWIEATRSREVFLLAVVALCMGTAWLTALAGLSLALGAFLGGLVIASTEFKHRAMGEMLPLRELFTALFFVSLGMLFDVRILVAAPLAVLGLVLAFTLLKGAIATAAALAMRFPARTSWLAGVALAQFGEFGFVLLSLARREELIDPAIEGAVIAAGVTSMFLTPLLIRLAPHLRAGEALLRPLARLLGAGPGADGADQAPAKDHVVVAGLGVAGRLLLEGLDELGVGFVALDLVAERVTELRARHPNVYYADVTSEEALHHAHVEHARAVVIAINDPEAVQRALAAIRRVNPRVPIWVRTRYAAEQPQLVALGATEVVCEEIESASRLLALVLGASGAEDEAVARYQERARDAVRRSLVPDAPRA
jgi:CPA2 family monovalent cation:H+ antiporter-2